MKKLTLILAFALISIITYSQTTYKNLVIKEPTHCQDDEFASCYVVVDNWAVHDGNALVADIYLSVYKSKAISIAHPDWEIFIIEIGNLQIKFEFGDPINAITIAQGVKAELLRQHPTWDETNIIIK